MEGKVGVTVDVTDTTVVSLYSTRQTRPSCIIHRWTIDTTVVSIVHLWTVHDGLVRRVKYKGHDRRVNSVPKTRHDGHVRNQFQSRR